MKRTLLLLSSVLMGAAAFAQSFTATWVQPVPAAVDAYEYSTFPAEGDSIINSYYLYNTGVGAFFTEGNAWGTQASVGTTGLKVAIAKYTVDDAWDDKTVFIYDYSLAKKAWKQLFIDSETQSYVDLGSQANYYWEIEAQGNKTFRIKGADLNPTYNSFAYASGDGSAWFGMSSTPDPETAISPLIDLVVDPTASVDWQFISEEAYEAYLPAGQIYAAALALKKQIEWAMEQGVTAATLADEFAVYNNTSSTLEQLQEAAASAYAKGRYMEIAVYFEGIIPGEKNDVSGVIANNDFSAGNVDGWDITYTASSTEATNIGYQSASYTNGDVSISGFIEAWKADSKPAYLGDGSITQTIPSLPQGKYTLGVDVIANNQGRISDDNNPNGYPDDVELFAMASADGKTFKTDMYTKNGAPEHFEFTFVHTGGDMTMGLRVVNSAEAKMPANWIAMDNLKLYYYGEVTDDPDKVLLDAAIDEALAVYSLDEVDDLVAYVGDKEAYKSIIEEAQAATEDWASYIPKVKAALSQLTASVEAYEKFASKKDEWEANSARFEFDSEDWDAFCDFAGGMDTPEGYPELLPQDVLDEQSLSIEEIEAYIALVDQLYKTAVANSLQPGDDVTALLENPDFEYGLSSGAAEGWTVVRGSGTNLTPGPLGTDLDQLMIDAIGKTNHCFEGWHRYNWDVYQEVKSAPAGVYEITCQGYVRCEMSGYSQGQELTDVPIKLYMNNFESNFPDVYSEQVPEDKYNENGALPVIESWSWTGDNYPNSMGGASLCFAWGMYQVHTFGLVQEGESMRIGVKNTASTDWWCIWDNFHVTYRGFEAEYVQPALETALANLDISKPMAKSLFEAVSALNAEAQDAIASGDGQAMYDVLVKVNAMANTVAESVSLFNKLNTAAEDLITAAYEYDNAKTAAAIALANEVINHIEARDIENEDAEAYLVKIAQMKGELALPEGYESASDENPFDMTGVIVNPDFETGDASGWTYAFASVTNIGFQNNSTYSNTDDDGTEANISNFIEGWHSSTNIGDGTLEQVIYALPEGTYTLEADIIACNQYGDENEGFFLFAAEQDGAKSSIPVATESGKPLHYALTFVKASAETTLTIGVQALNATSNWLAADNFTLTYFGKASAKTADGDASGIESVEGAKSVKIEYFTLDGRKVTTAQKGIMIQKATFDNGAVVIRKVRK